MRQVIQPLGMKDTDSVSPGSHPGALATLPCKTGLCASTWIVHEGSKACARDPGLRRKFRPLFWAFAAGFSPPRQAIFPRA